MHNEDELVKKRLLDTLIRDLGDDLKRLAYLYVNDLAESEDIIQEVFIKCYHQLDYFRHESSYKTWLIRMTINQCKDYKKRWNVRNLFYRKELPEAADQKLTEPTYIQKEFTNEMMRELNTLAPKYKEVLILYYYEELTMLEISEVLQIKHNTVKSRLLRGKNLLKERLERGEWNG